MPREAPKKLRLLFPEWLHRLSEADPDLCDDVRGALLTRSSAVKTGASDAELTIPDALIDSIADRKIGGAVARRKAGVALRAYERAVRPSVSVSVPVGCDRETFDRAVRQLAKGAHVDITTDLSSPRKARGATR